jgi:2-polyprenyl-6-hydroxyphenyl methylase/3-demethylubiquinone-9 3-methyltransferase
MNRGAYYKEKLSARKLLRCYEMAPPKITQYLNSEIQFVISKTRPSYLVLELGCGYGRVVKNLAPFAEWVVGIDISKESLELARSYLKGLGNCSVFLMDASQMAFDSCTFDSVFCIQNGISAFGVNQKCLVAESIRITKENGLLLFSSYSPKIWKARLEWFNLQSELGLIGEIDEDKTCDGTIVCRDGFKATTVSENQLVELFDEYGLKASVTEVDESSIFACARKTNTAMKPINGESSS